MDDILKAKLEELKRYFPTVAVKDLSAQDAINMATDNDCLYVYAQNGYFYELRWTNGGQIYCVHETEVAGLIADHMLEVGRSRALTSPVLEAKIARKRKVLQELS